MKTFKIIIFLQIMICSIFAQSVPQGMNYQAVARDAKGAVLANQVLSLQVKLTAGSEGKTLYSEIHDITTNKLGLFDVVIGQGFPESGTFDEIKWSENEVWMNIAIEEKGTYTSLGNSKLWTAPYAMHAGSADHVKGAEGLQKSGAKWSQSGNSVFAPNLNKLGSTNNEDVIIITNNTERMRWEKDGDINISNNLDVTGEVSADTYYGDGSNLTGIDVNDADADPTNELQNWDNLPGIPTNIDTDATDDFSGSFNDLTDVPTDLADGDNVEDADSDPTNELQNWSNLPGIPNNIDTDATDDFSGSYNDLTDVPTDLADGDDVNDADADPTNELQAISYDGSTNLLSLTNGGNADLSDLDESLDIQNISSEIQSLEAAINQVDDLLSNEILLLEQNISHVNTTLLNELQSFEDDFTQQNQALNNQILQLDQDIDQVTDLLNTNVALLEQRLDQLDAALINQIQMLEDNMIQVHALHASQILALQNDLTNLSLDLSHGLGGLAQDLNSLSETLMEEIAILSLDINDINNDITDLTTTSSQTANLANQNEQAIAQHLLDDQDQDPTNELQNWSNLPGIPTDIDTDATDDFSGSYNDLTDVPADLVDGDNVDDADSDPENELQSWDNLPGIPANIDTDATDDFSGSYNDLTDVPIDQVDDADNDPTNELEMPGANPGDMAFFNGSFWQQLPAGSEGQLLVFTNGVPTWVTTSLLIPNYASLLQATLPNGSTLYVHPTDNSTSIKWGPTNFDVPSIPNSPNQALAFADMNGESNTAGIVNSLADFNNGNYAAKLCYDLVAFGFDDWYLPSVGEWHVISQQLGPTGSGNISGIAFQTSSEQSITGVWRYTVNTSSLSGAHKSTNMSCRCVRKE